MKRDAPHDWLEIGVGDIPARRWCVRAYAKGGCGCYQIWRERTPHNKASWFPPTGETCTAQLAKIAEQKAKKLESRRRKQRKLAAAGTSQNGSQMPGNS